MRLRATLKALCPPLLWETVRGRHDPHSDDVLDRARFLDGWRVIDDAVAAYRARHPRPTFVDVGGRDGRHQGVAKDCDYLVLDIEPRFPHALRGDICDCPQIPDASHDIVFSNSLFEHVKEPWRAAASIGRILKPGGLAITRTLFAWEYHEKPVDFWRFTDSALSFLFERYGGLTTERAGYDVSNRWRNCGTAKFHEHWEVIHIGVKPGTAPLVEREPPTGR